MSRTHPVKLYEGQDGADDIATALALVRVCKVATIDTGWVCGDVVAAVSATLDLAEKYLAAGAEWARDTQNQITREENEKLRRKMMRTGRRDGGEQ